MLQMTDILPSITLLSGYNATAEISFVVLHDGVATRLARPLSPLEVVNLLAQLAQVNRSIVTYGSRSPPKQSVLELDIYGRGDTEPLAEAAIENVVYE